MIDSLTRELKEMKLKEMLMQEALEHSGETARMDSLRQAEQKQRIDSLRQTTPGVPLIIDGDTLLVVYASLGGESPVSRVESLQYKILQLGKSLKMTTDTLHIFESEYTADIMSGELVMMRVSDLDGLWHGMTRRQLAEENMRVISQAIEALQNEYGLEAKLEGLGWAVLVIVAQIVLLMLTFRLIRRLRRKILSGFSGKIKPVVAKGYEVKAVHISPESVTVAARGEVLSQMTELALSDHYVDLKGLTDTTSFQIKVSKPSDDAVLSNDTITVTVEVEPVEKTEE